MFAFVRLWASNIFGVHLHVLIKFVNRSHQWVKHLILDQEWFNKQKTWTLDAVAADCTADADIAVHERAINIAGFLGQNIGR